jgi:mono/diheme cytochrome c family protein
MLHLPTAGLAVSATGSTGGRDHFEVGFQNPAAVFGTWGERLWAPAVEITNGYGFTVFHRDPGSGVTCASCHPEGNEDGLVWDFVAGVDGVVVAGPRKTPALTGLATERAPYHWLGELATKDDLVRSALTMRMGGFEPDPALVDALFTWLDGLPVRRPRLEAGEAALVPQGEQLFLERGCAGCHTGPALTTNAVVAVRPDGLATKVPSLLGVGSRPVLMHDGCAASLRELFTGPDACTGGDLHGQLSGLDEARIDAFVAWLKTL